MGKITLSSLAAFLLLFAVPGSSAQERTNKQTDDRARATVPCSEMPGGNGLRFVCATPVFPHEAQEDEDTDNDAVASALRISLRLPEGTALRIAIDQHTRISHVGEEVRGHVVDAVYAFDEPVIPAGSVVTGRVTEIAPVPVWQRAEAYTNGNFSPFHKFKVTFDRLTLPDGRELAIETTVSPASADVVHLVSKPPDSNEEEKEEHKSATARAAAAAKQEAKESVQQANASAHQAMDEIRSPGKMHRLKQYLLAQAPYRKQYLEEGTRYSASLRQELDFGFETQSQEELEELGNLPVADTLLRARLVLEVNSATATRGTPVVAELTEPVYSANRHLLLPSGSRLIGQVVEARPARHLHRNGELRVIFEHIEVPGGSLQEVQGTLEGIEVDRSAHMKLDEEGGAHGTDSKSRYLSTGIALLVAAAAAHPDVERGVVDPAGDPAVRASAGASGFGLAGTVIGLVSKSSAVSILFSAYGASTSIYANFLSRGHEVVLPKDAPLEIGLGTKHPRGRAKAH